MRSPALWCTPASRQSFKEWPRAEWIAGYIDGRSAVRVAFEGELADETDVFLYLFAVEVHLADIVLAAFHLQPPEHVLVVPHDLNQLSLAVRLVQGLLLVLAEVVVETCIGGLAALG